MNKNIKISNDGTIFEIKEDGSISKLARISESGAVLPLNGISSETQNKTSSGKGSLRFFLIFFIITTIAFAVSYFNMKDEYSFVSYQLQDKINQSKSAMSKSKSQIQELEDEVSFLNNRIQKIGNKMPFIVTDIKMGNMNANGSMYTDYGSSIYSSSSMYLSPKIYYDGIKSGSYTIYWKIFYPDGTMSTGRSSPSGYSTSGTFYINEGDGNSCTLSGWGSETKGNWRSGTYRIEIWYNNSCLKSKNFTIY